MEKLKSLDDQLFLYLNNMGTPSWDGFWVFITNQWYAMPFFALLAWLVYRKTGMKSAIASFFVLGACLVFTVGISHAFKYGIMRPRPCNVDWNFRYPLTKECGDYGFFSTHASVGIAMMLYLGFILKKYYRWIMWPLMLWVFLFSYSRIYLGKHYPGDIIVGLLFGAVFAIIFWQIRKWVERRFKI